MKSSSGSSALSRCLHLQGYTTDPASLPVQYRAELAVEGASGALGPDSLRITLCGARGETGVLHLDASRAAAGRTLACTFEAANVGQMERLRIGLAPADAAAGVFCAAGTTGRGYTFQASARSPISLHRSTHSTTIPTWLPCLVEGPHPVAQCF